MATSDTLTRGALPRIQWAPVLAGVFFAIALHVLFGLFGVAFGFGAGAANSDGAGAGAAIWGALTPLLATFVGAMVAVRCASALSARSAQLHGMLVWCIGIIAGAIFLTGSMAAGINGA